MRHATITTRAMRGVTLIELMVTLVIVVIVLFFATGPFGTLVAQNRMTAAVNDFIGSLNVARTMAVMGRSAATVCPEKNGGCGSADSDWGNGAIVFNDANGDRTLDAGEVVKTRWAVSPNITVKSNVTAITYNHDGTAVLLSGTGTSLWLFCDPDGRASPRIVAVYESGANSLYKPADCILAGVSP